MVSFEVVSLFTRVSISESLNLLVRHFSEGILALLRLVLLSTSVLMGNSTCGQMYVGRSRSKVSYFFLLGNGSR